MRMLILPFHLPHTEDMFPKHDCVVQVLPRTKFSAWMECNREFPDARNLLYTEFPTKWVWDVKTKMWRRRVKGTSTGTIAAIPPYAGELYYLSILLHVVRGPVCFEDIRTVYGIVHPTFRSACLALNLF